MKERKKTHLLAIQHFTNDKGKKIHKLQNYTIKRDKKNDGRGIHRKDETEKRIAAERKKPTRLLPQHCF